MIRVAVQAGGAWLRVAAEGRLLAELPAAGADLAAVLAGVCDAPPDEVLVVQPSGPPVSVAPILAPAARTVPAAVAALAGLVDGATGDGVVVDVGHTGAEVARVCGGRVVAVRRVPVGGARLDAATAELLARAGVIARPAEARRVREALALLPTARAGPAAVPIAAAALRAALTGPLVEVVEAVRAVVGAAVPGFDGSDGSGRAPPVLLIGGVARTPLVAELLDAAGIDGVRVADRPDAAAVVGALRLPAVAAGRAAASAHPAAPVRSWLPPSAAPRRLRLRLVLGVLAALAALVGLLGTGVALSPPGRPLPVAGELVQYGYAVDLPAGWVHTGGLPERRRSLLTPAAAPDGSDLVSVERTPLGYDATAEPERARAELRATYAAAVAAGAALSGFDADARYAGRAVVVYREAGGASAADVDWYVVLDGDAQLSVGCRHTRTGTAAVGAACATVVGSLRRTA